MGASEGDSVRSFKSTTVLGVRDVASGCAYSLHAL